MFKRIDRLLMMVIFAISGPVQALPIVSVDGREWLQPADFLSISWNYIASVCSPTTGDCTSGPLGTVTDMGPWTWAGVDDVNALFNSVVGNTAMGPGPDEVDYGFDSVFPLFTAAGFSPTRSDRLSTQISGWTRTLCNQFRCFPTDPNNREAYIGVVAQGFGYDGIPAVDVISTAISANAGASLAVGGWFFRDPLPPQSAPTPDTAALLALAIATLGYTCRKRSLTN